MGSVRAGLTRRQQQVLYWVAALGSATAVAKRLRMSYRTVERHLDDVRAQLGVSTTLQCVMWALRGQQYALGEQPTGSDGLLALRPPVGAYPSLVAPLTAPLPGRVVELPADAPQLCQSLATGRADGGGGAGSLQLGVAHDGEWLYLTLGTQPARGHDVYASLIWHGLRRALSSPEPSRREQELHVGQPGPGGWPGYRCFNRVYRDASDRRPLGTGSDVRSLPDGLVYGFKLPLWLLPVDGMGRLSLAFKVGTDGTWEHTWRCASGWAAGQVVFVDLLLEPLATGVPVRAPEQRVTQRELDVLQALADLGTGAAVAERLGMSPRTAEVHLRSVREKLDVETSLAAVVWAKRAGGIG